MLIVIITFLQNQPFLTGNREVNPKFVYDPIETFLVDHVFFHLFQEAKFLLTLLLLWNIQIHYPLLIQFMRNTDFDLRNLTF